MPTHTHTVQRHGLIGGALLLASATLAMAQPSTETPESLTLPGGPVTLYVHPRTGKLTGMTANARYHLELERLTDTWQRRPITTLEELAASAAIIPYEEIARLLDDLDPLTIGDGPTPVIAFVAPSCPACHDFFRELPALGDRYRFHLLLVALNETDIRLVRQLDCTTDPEAARRALLTDDYGELRLGPCEPTAIANRAVVAQMLGVRETPFLIRLDGVIHRGRPADLAAWLRDARP